MNTKDETELERIYLKAEDSHSGGEPSTVLNEIIDKIEAREPELAQPSLSKHDKAFSLLAHQIVGAEIY